MLNAAVLMFVAPVVWSAPAAGPDGAAAIPARLESMEAAVLAGDGDAYMASIAAGDGEFTTEQRHWADDLKLHKPAAFDLEFAGASGPGDGAGADRTEGVLKMSWTMEGAEPRKVEYPAAFVRQGDSWLYAGEVWTVVEGEGVRALCAKGLAEDGEEVVGVFPEVRAHDEEGFELKVDRVQTVKLYSSMPHLQASIYLSYVDGLGGWNEPGESIKILAGGHMGRNGYRTVLAHEFGHVCTFEMGPKASGMPWWALEGAAELAAEKFSRGWDGVDAYVRTLASAGRLGAWERLSDFRSTPLSDYGLVYPQGHHMLSYVSEQWGRTARNAWLRAMAQGKSIDDATRETLGLGFADLDAKWRESLGVTREKPTPAGE